MQSARMSNLKHDSQIQLFYEHNWLGEDTDTALNIFPKTSFHTFIHFIFKRFELNRSVHRDCCSE